MPVPQPRCTDTPTRSKSACTINSEGGINYRVKAVGVGVGAAVSKNDGGAMVVGAGIVIRSSIDGAVGIEVAAVDKRIRGATSIGDGVAVVIGGRSILAWAPNKISALSPHAREEDNSLEAAPASQTGRWLPGSKKIRS